MGAAGRGQDGASCTQGLPCPAQPRLRSVLCPPDVLNVQHLATRFLFLNIFSTPSRNPPPALAVLSRGDLQQMLGSEGLGKGHVSWARSNPQAQDPLLGI